jgi:hypothetical protein
MGMLQFQPAPSVPAAPVEYSQAFMDSFSNVLRLFYNNVNAVQQLNLAALNLDLRTLPTDAAYDQLRFGDVYRDTQGGTVNTGTNILRIKVPVNMNSVSASGAVGTVIFTKSVSLTGTGSTGTVGTVTP